MTRPVLTDRLSCDVDPRVVGRGVGGGGGGTAGLFEKSAGLIGTHVRVTWHVQRLSSIYLCNLAVVSSYPRVFKPINLTRNRISFNKLAI